MRKIHLIILLCFLCSFGTSVFLYYKNETHDIEKQEQVNELVAEDYLIYVSQQSSESNANKSENLSQDSNITVPTDFDYDDNKIYSYFSEEMASGRVDCVLEIPAIDLRQSIYTGTVEQIEHDLSKWLPVTARADYILGDTHYAIYIHNPRNKSIKISQAQENLKVNDYMVVTQNNLVYFYEITNIFPEWRNICDETYVNNNQVNSDKLYIFTCGRDAWQGRNLVIEGTVYEIYSIIDWNANKDQYVKNYKDAKDGIDPPVIVQKENIIMSVVSEKESIVVSLRNESYTQFSDCSIGLFSADGELLQKIEYVGEDIVIKDLDCGEYYIGLYENNTEYDSPEPYKIVIDKERHVQTIISVQEEANFEKDNLIIIKTVAILIASIAFCLLIFIVCENIAKRKKKIT